MSKSVKKTSPEKIAPAKKKSGKTTKQLMAIHMQDKEHKITAEDIENLDLNLEHVEKNPPPVDVTPEDLEIPENPDAPKDDDEHKKHVTPWDVIS